MVICSCKKKDTANIKGSENYPGSIRVYINDDIYTESGSIAITYSAGEIAIAAAAIFNPIVGGIAGILWLLAGDTAWEQIMEGI